VPEVRWCASFGRIDGSDRLVGAIHYAENFLRTWVFWVLVIGGVSFATQGFGPDSYPILGLAVTFTGIIQLVRYLFARSEAQEILAFILFDETRPGSAPRATGAFSPVRLAIGCLGALLIYFAFLLVAAVVGSIQQHHAPKPEIPTPTAITEDQVADFAGRLEQAWRDQDSEQFTRLCHRRFVIRKGTKAGNSHDLATALKTLPSQRALKRTSLSIQSLSGNNASATVSYKLEPQTIRLVATISHESGRLVLDSLTILE